MDFADRFVTVGNPLEAYKQVHIDLIAAQLTLQYFDHIALSTQIRDPLPGWSHEALLSHIEEFLDEVATVAEEAPRLTGFDALERRSRAVARVQQVFRDRRYHRERRPTPMGIQPGVVMIQYVVNELVVHLWDFATAINRRCLLPEWLGERCLLSWQVYFETFGRPAEHFAPERPAPPNVNATTRLAAFLGREIPDTPVVLWKDPALIAAGLKRVGKGNASRNNLPRRRRMGDEMEVTFAEIPEEESLFL